MSEPSRGGERQHRRETIEEVARDKREHLKRTIGKDISQEQAVRSVRDNYLNSERRQGKE
jgi:hypothetical protein